jgi:Phosphotransferase enzyme family
VQTTPRYSRHAWLAAAVPVSARRFCVDDSELAETLRAAGAELGEAGDAEVAIVSLVSRAHAPQAIVCIDHGARDLRGADPPPLAVKTGRRLVASAAVRTKARRARLSLARRGYRTRSVLWDLEQPLRPTAWGGRLSPAERLPRAALVLGAAGAAGAAGAPTPTTLDAITAEVGAAEVEWSLPLVQESRLVMLGGPGVLRVSIGPGAQTIEDQERVIGELSTRSLPSAVEARLPAILMSGRTGLARWTLERRLPGRTPPAPLAESVLEQCLELLVDLHAVRGRDGRDLRQGAAVVADACPPDEAAAVRRLGARLVDRLADVPRGFGHGDFWRGNLLVRDGVLSGVIDWEDACPAQLPLLDLFHLELTARRLLTPEQWGTAVIDRLLPEVRAGGSRLIRAYCDRTGLQAGSGLLTDLVLAYWLDRVAVELRSFADRRLRTDWMRHNVIGVLRAAEALTG